MNEEGEKPCWDRRTVAGTNQQPFLPPICTFLRKLRGRRAGINISQFCIILGHGSLAIIPTASPPKKDLKRKSGQIHTKSICYGF
ncbi:hypothetical protein Nepgr_020879 [Nepenthes gracilis]|uniref:Uncharacterized protein n=1 Tax=Nepenthes gracilis TaxID=150966 RepID=A0AAD3SW07_NEPGR|nr:hypothetical protein Nepgr_020879 [Nepenthes gracilis]